MQLAHLLVTMPHDIIGKRKSRFYKEKQLDSEESESKLNKYPSSSGSEIFKRTSQTSWPLKSKKAG